MPYLKQDGLSHRDWFVQAINAGPGFRFCCHHASLGKQTDGVLYSTSEAALIAGCGFINREQAIVQLAQVLDEWVLTEKISLEEYWDLSTFLSKPE